jgi:hypothetical protein
MSLCNYVSIAILNIFKAALHLKVQKYLTQIFWKCLMIGLNMNNGYVCVDNIFSDSLTLTPFILFWSPYLMLHHSSASKSITTWCRHINIMMKPRLLCYRLRGKWYVTFDRTCLRFHFMWKVFPGSHLVETPISVFVILTYPKTGMFVLWIISRVQGKWCVDLNLTNGNILYLSLRYYTL